MRMTFFAAAVTGMAFTAPAIASQDNSAADLAQYQNLSQAESPGESEGETKPRTPARPIPPSRNGVVPKSQNAQCSWTGKRMMHVLLRDDLIAADGFMRFYETFGCPVTHLGDAFGCSIGLGDDAPVEEVDQRVDACWADPASADAPATGLPEEAEPPKAVEPPAETAPKPNAGQ